MDLLALFSGFVVQYGIFGVFLVALICNATIFLPLPVDFFMFAMGALAMKNPSILFGPLMIGLVGGIGAGLGELTGYLVGYEVEELVLKRRNIHFQRAEKYFEKYGFWALPIFGFIPLIPVDIWGLVAGVLEYNWKKFLLGITIGKVLRYTLLAYAGYYGIDFVLSVFQLWR
jgi:membrane protein YqaA with SNARE-associated domain